MRGHVDPQAQMFSYFSPEQRVSANHALRSIKANTDSALQQIRPVLDGLQPNWLSLDSNGAAVESATADRNVLGAQRSAFLRVTTLCSAGSWTWDLRKLLSTPPRLAGTVSDWRAKRWP
jgi:hypothetical protein